MNTEIFDVYHSRENHNGSTTHLWRPWSDCSWYLRSSWNRVWHMPTNYDWRVRHAPYCREICSETLDLRSKAATNYHLHWAKTNCVRWNFFVNSGYWRRELNLWLWSTNKTIIKSVANFPLLQFRCCNKCTEITRNYIEKSMLENVHNITFSVRPRIYRAYIIYLEKPIWLQFFFFKYTLTNCYRMKHRRISIVFEFSKLILFGIVRVN